MHPTFEKLSQKPDEVDEIICTEPEKAKFSKVFHNLFPTNGKFRISSQSFLNLLYGFEFNIKELLEEQKVVNKLYQKFNIDHKTKDGFYKFWVFLVQMYNTLINNKSPTDRCKRPNFDNIFAFMNPFPIKETRVVMIGKDPAQTLESSGFAFHGSDCRATHKLVKFFFNNDLRFLENQGQAGRKPKVFTQKIFNLDGWIEQGVLMFNTYLSYGEHSKELWLNFTKFLVKTLNSECDCLVFILACGEANKEFSGLIGEKHKVFNVYHPTHRKQIRPDLQWEIQKPFLRANQFFYQKEKLHMIDWEMVGKSDRMEKYENYFKSLSVNEEEKETEDDEETTDNEKTEEEKEYENDEETEEDEDNENDE